MLEYVGLLTRAGASTWSVKQAVDVAEDDMASRHKKK